MTSHPIPANVTFHSGDIFTSAAAALVNPVNCVGVMGAGLAKQFKARDQTMFERYRRQCADGTIRPGHPVIDWDATPAVIHFPTKLDWRNPSRLAWIAEGLIGLATLLSASSLDSVAVPPLGCGHGGLCWPEVRNLTLQHLGALDTQILIYGSAPAQS